ncbi:hypothetical protein SAMN05421507_13610 [Lentzea jiangxiensis]|uniref:Cholesterol esterase n=2 Tax=Lentzea jiangxiensis TaxID=641025 RepID=A0A1H0X5C0_9PSEU|nr:hypothetical protein SAMN05421507_13610 [Lentzea jiangxiensis]
MLKAGSEVAPRRKAHAMADAGQHERPEGRTSRRRLVYALAPTALAATVILSGVGEGALAASFTGANPFTITAARIESDGLGIGTAVSPGRSLATLVVRLPVADIEELCQSSTIELPVIGKVTTVLRAEHVHATDLALEMNSIDGNIDLKQLLLGPQEPNGAIGYRASRVVLDQVTINAGSVAAGSFMVTGVRLDHHLGTQGCPAPTKVAR